MTEDTSGAPVPSWPSRSTETPREEPTPPRSVGRRRRAGFLANVVGGLAILALAAGLLAETARSDDLEDELTELRSDLRQVADSSGSDEALEDLTSDLGLLRAEVAEVESRPMLPATQEEFARLFVDVEVLATQLAGIRNDLDAGIASAASRLEVATLTRTVDCINQVLADFFDRGDTPITYLC